MIYVTIKGGKYHENKQIKITKIVLNFPKCKERNSANKKLKD